MTGLICERLIRHGQKTGTFSQISPDILDRFSPYESTLRADNGHVLIFQFLQWKLHGNQTMLQKCYQRQLIPLAIRFPALVQRMQYHGLAVHANSGDDGATSCKNFVNFCLVNPEITGLTCVHLV